MFYFLFLVISLLLFFTFMFVLTLKLNESHIHFYYFQVRVRHLFSHVDENIVPKWDGELEDENVNHLIRDILHDCVNRKAWDLLETSVTKRTKRKESAPVNVSWDSTNKNKKAKPMEDCRYNVSTILHFGIKY